MDDTKYRGEHELPPPISFKQLLKECNIPDFAENVHINFHSSKTEISRINIRPLNLSIIKKIEGKDCKLVHVGYFCIHFTKIAM